MSLSFDWSPLATLVADLKALVGLGVQARFETTEGQLLSVGSRVAELEARPQVPAYDEAPVLSRLDALEAADAAGIDPVTMGRIVALEQAISALSLQLAAYAAPEAPKEPVDPPVEPPPEEPPVEEPPA